MGGRVLIIIAALVVLVCGSANAGGSKYCEEVFSDFLPCMDYVGGLTPKTPRECCDGIQKINKMASLQKEAPGKICSCIEDVAHDFSLQLSIQIFNVARIESLSKDCHILRSFPISIAMDRSKI